ncbi:hypothetical protein EDD69_102171 [Thermolongibacillus altinsuensis]|jgi:transcriptional regulator of met regulon|uniref:Fur-regulated basic protein A n=1 Tax=Thermolongibacillus altinsuensis TaxID=575256 RepID=A0A4R1QKQ9_9BACL|nr:hypothetical protein [Thermolongibacillus altinsuensis]TCL52765.1 hypothetical protein EDD69_102171 [Thermolongibacillus altinsuensis]GMB09399.1 hypothetical protein B1no1_21090 [Thermolongibacillus altinsuensis]
MKPASLKQRKLAEILYYQAYEQPLPNKDYTVVEINEMIQEAKKALQTQLGNEFENEEEESDLILH